MIKQGEQRLVPKLRFKGFSEDWEQEKLKNVVITNPYEELPEKFNYVNLESVLGTSLISYECTNIENAPSRAQRLAKKGDIFFQNVRPYQKNNFLFNLDCSNYVFSTGYTQLRPKLNSGFLFSIIQKNKFVNKVLNRCTGSSYPAISSKDLVDIKVNISRNIEEQNKIADFIGTIDKLLTLHNLKKEKIEKLKLDLVRRLDFSLIEESDEVVLGDLIEIKSGYGFKSEEFSNNGIPLVRISDIDSGIVKKPGTFIKEDSKYIDFLIKSGDYLIAMSGATTGKIGRYTLNHDAYCNQRIGIIRGIENKIDNNYLEYVLHSSKFQHYISTQWGAGAQPNINLKQIKDYKLRLPKLSEQKLIGSIFANLNRQKDIHKVEQLLSLKELYLNKLFI